MSIVVDRAACPRPPIGGGALPGLGRSVQYLVLPWLVFGCGAPAVGPPDPPADPCAAARAIRSTTQFLTVAEEADVAARVTPGGFGGLYENLESERLVVTLKNPAQSGPAEAALRALLNCGGAYPGWADELVTPSTMGFRSAEWTGTELLAYLRALQPVRSDPAVWAMEIDPELNRIWIGLRSAGDIARMRQSVTDLAVPLGAIVLEPPPPATGVEPFAVLEDPMPTQTDPKLGVFGLSFHVRYINTFSEPRYLDRCPDSFSPHTNVRYFLERWDGTEWKLAFAPICELTALRPTALNPSEAHTDSVGNTAVRRLKAIPIWRTVRITGTYRLLGSVYLTETADPPYVADPAPEAERRSAPFRILHGGSF